MEDRKKNIAEIRRLIEEKKKQHLFSEITRFLIVKGISKVTAEEIIRQLSVQVTDGYEKCFGFLQEILATHVKTCDGLQFSKGEQKVVALVGPRGVGKTTTALKLASHYGVNGGKTTRLISLDTEKAGALEQLEKYATEWKIPLSTGLERVQELKEELIIIDTTGCNFYQTERVDQIAQLFLAQESPVEIHLALSMATKDIDLYGAIHQFSALKPASLIFTKMDETLTTGVLINVSSKTHIPISHIAYGYPLPGELHVADSRKIAHKILAERNEEEFNFLRQLLFV